LGSQITHMVMDKTGTLTVGKPKVKAVAALELGGCPAWEKLLLSYRQSCAGSSKSTPLTPPLLTWLQAAETSLLTAELPSVETSTQEEAQLALWWAIGAAELSSEHPLAKELVDVASGVANAEQVPAKNFENITGIGVKGNVGGVNIFVGSAKFVLQGDHTQSAATHALAEWINGARTDGCTVVAVAVDNMPLAAVALRDQLAPHAKACVEHLQQRGTEVWICTGDHQASAQVIARECGVDAANIVAEALPADKVALVQRLQGEKGAKGKKSIVAMVGDGINDAPALAAADLGIAIGCGHNVTVDAADVVLVRMDLRDLVTFCALARDTLSTIWRNFLWAFMFNSCALPVAAGGLWHFRILMTPQIAICLMMSSSLLVVFSSLSLRGFTPQDVQKKQKCDAIAYLP